MNNLPKFSRWRQHPVDDDEKLVFFKVQTPQKAALPSMRFSLRIWGVSRVKIATNFPLTSEEQKGDWRSLIPFLKNSNGHGQLCILWSLISQIDHNWSFGLSLTILKVWFLSKNSILAKLYFQTFCIKILTNFENSKSVKFWHFQIPNFL